MKIAIIDLGTNTFNILISDMAEDYSYTILHERKIPVKLGKGGIKNKIISPEAFVRGLEAIESHYKKCKELEVDRIAAFATSGIRSAQNGKDFIREIKKQFDISVEIIDGNREAELIYKGIRLSLGLGNEEALILDIGGGSNEFILCNKKEIIWKKSYNLGVARLLEKFKPSDPISADEIKLVESYLEKELGDLLKIASNRKIDTLVGASGTFDTLAEMLKLENKIEEKNETCHIIQINDLDYLVQKFISSTLDQRLEMQGLPAFRAEYIVLAGIFVSFVVHELNIKKIIHSSYSLKEGVLAELIEFI